MKKQNLLFLFVCFLLLMICTGKQIKTLPDLALDSFSKILENPFFIEVFDLDQEEAVEVFGDRKEDIFL